MTGLELVLAIAGVVVFALVVAAMVLIVPRGAVEGHAGTTDPIGSLPNRKA